MTIRLLFAGLISLVAYAAATLLSLGLFVENVPLLWMVVLFSAAFGLGTQPPINNYLSGMSSIFEDTLRMGKKIELPGTVAVAGVLENFGLRVTSIKALSGELLAIPDGEIRTVRNFSRGNFSWQITP